MPGFFSPSQWEAKTTKSPTIPKCGECGLYKDCFSPKMEVTGKGKKKILFVAEAPGEAEDRQGTQLIGKSGQFLRKILKEMRFNLGDAWKTNAIICRPPKSKMEDRYIEACRANLLNTIKKLKPNVIVLLGSSGLKSLLPLDWGRNIGQLEKWVGWTIPSTQFNAWLCPTWHPSYVLRMNEDPALIKIFKQHIRAAIDLENRKPPLVSIDDLKSKIEVITSPRDARLRLRGLNDKKGLLAFDYETTGLKPDSELQKIVSCSFCLDGEDTFACMIDDKIKSILSMVLKNKYLKKVASNMKYEERWTLAKLGHKVRNWHWDTMLAAHILDNRRGITSIKFQAYVLLGVPDYNSSIKPYLQSNDANGLNRIEKVDVHDLLIYNGMDSLLEYMVMEKQKEMMER